MKKEKSDSAAGPKCISRIWTDSKSVWVNWISQRYVADQSLLNIPRNKYDSHRWKAFLDIIRMHIGDLMQCGKNYIYASRLGVDAPKFTTFKNEIRTTGSLDPYADGIWGCKKKKINKWLLSVGG